MQTASCVDTMFRNYIVLLLALTVPEPSSPPTAEAWFLRRFHELKRRQSSLSISTPWQDSPRWLLGSHSPRAPEVRARFRMAINMNRPCGIARSRGVARYGTVHPICSGGVVHVTLRSRLRSLMNQSVALVHRNSGPQEHHRPEPLC